MQLLRHKYFNSDWVLGTTLLLVKGYAVSVTGSPGWKKKHSALKRQGRSYCAHYIDKGFHSYCKHNFILKILLDQMPEAVASIRKEERASRRLFYFTGRSLRMTARAVTRSPAGEAVTGHQLVLHCLWFIVFDSSFFFLSGCSSCFLCGHPLGLPTAVSGTGSQQSTLLSQSLLSRLFNCAGDHVTFILPNNNSLWVICS